MEQIAEESMKPKRNSLLRLFFSGGSSHKLSLLEMVERELFRKDRQLRFNYCTRQSAKLAWMRDHRSVEICRALNEIGDFKLMSKHGRSWLHGRGCVRPGSPIRLVQLTNKYRGRVGGRNVRAKPIRKKSQRPDHI